MDALERLGEILPLLVPILIIQLVLIVVALRDLMRRPSVRGPKWVWAAVILFGNLLGPILYFVVAREDE